MTSLWRHIGQKANFQLWNWKITIPMQNGLLNSKIKFILSSDHVWRHCDVINVKIKLSSLDPTNSDPDAAEFENQIYFVSGLCTTSLWRHHDVIKVNSQTLNFDPKNVDSSTNWVTEPWSHIYTMVRSCMIVLWCMRVSSLGIKITIY